MQVPSIRRRQALALAAALGAPSFVRAQARPAPVNVVQLFDTSPDQQDLSRDYSTGLRLAFTELARSGARVPRVTTLQVDGSVASLRKALQSVKDDGTQLALVGTVGERMALDSVSMARQMKLEIAHIAPWLSDTRFDAEPDVLPLFASREQQIAHALRSVAGTGIAEIGLVYPDAATERALRPGIEQAAAQLKLRVQSSTAPMLLLFLGGTLELALFTQDLAKRGLTRYVVCLADVDVTTLLQLGPGKGVPLILTQRVPNPQSSALEAVRRYRAGLKEWFDEAPSAVSLAGYFAGRYAAHALARVDGGIKRTALLAELQPRPALDLGGFRIDFARSGRGSDFVAQTMLRADGKLIG